jgi:cellulose synthase/poly-beta-1,6-N-acetylglucosamine synthase-like glycosyltransferase
LTHLLRQSVDDKLIWEVIIVDNVSTDDTSDVANSIWPKTAPAKLKVVFEPKLGTAFARSRGLNEAKYDLVSFVDDDNWINTDWLRRVFEIMSRNRNIGACGGYNEFKCEVNPPSWFDKYKESYAVGPQAPETGDITEKRGYLWGAGLTIRRSAWMKIKNGGFTFGSSGRQGDNLHAGEDSELCFALRLSGWRLWYDSGLRLTHFIKTEKLTWKYLRCLQRGFGASSIWFDPYLVLFEMGDRKSGQDVPNVLEVLVKFRNVR